MPGKRTQKRCVKTKRETQKEPLENTDTQKPIWMFDLVDRSGDFAFDVNRDGFLHKEVLDKMMVYSNLTWAEIKRQTHDDGKSKHHFINAGSLSKEAVLRLEIKKIEEYSDSIFSFALRNKLRIVGIREGQYFHVLWYDPEHGVCPSTLRNT